MAIKIGENVRTGVKIATTGSVQMMLSGLVTALIPPQVSILYKAAAFVGGYVLASYAGSKLDEYVDQQCDSIEDGVNAVQELVEAVKSTNEEETTEGA